MTEHHLVTEPAANLDVEAAFEWYNHELPELGFDFLAELRATYDRIAFGPMKYPELRNGIRRALVRRFPYAVYFAVEGDETIVILAVLHASRDPAEWQRRLR